MALDQRTDNGQVDWPAVDLAIRKAVLNQHLLAACVNHAGGEITLTHEEIGAATVDSFDVTHAPGGVTIKVTHRAGG